MYITIIIFSSVCIYRPAKCSYSFMALLEIIDFGPWHGCKYYIYFRTVT